MSTDPTADRPRARVAVTRSVDDNASLIAALEAIGVEAVAIPLVEVAPAGDGGAALAAAAADLERYHWVVLTSANGVRALVDALDGRPWPPGPAVAVVGPATAAAARSAGLPVDLQPAEATAAHLVADLPAGHGPVLAPLAELAGPTVVDGLTTKGWRVDRVEAYRTVAPATDAGGATGATRPEVDLVTFFSPSAVDRWVDRFGSSATPGPPAVCVGPATAARAERRGLAPIVVADPHTEAGVVAAVERTLAGPVGSSH